MTLLDAKPSPLDSKALGEVVEASPTVGEGRRNLAYGWWGHDALMAKVGRGGPPPICARVL